MNPIPMAIFHTKGELINILRRALEIEKGFENLAQWEAYVQSKNDDFRNTIFTMISESEHHASMVEGMLKELGADLDGKYGLKQMVFDFSGKDEKEILNELAKTEKLALDTYSNLKKTLVGTDTGTWLPQSSRGYIIDTLIQLILDEEHHCEIANMQVAMLEKNR